MHVRPYRFEQRFGRHQPLRVFDKIAQHSECFRRQVDAGSRSVRGQAPNALIGQVEPKAGKLERGVAAKVGIQTERLRGIWSRPRRLASVTASVRFLTDSLV
jgi:hypothetical protein